MIKLIDRYIFVHVVTGTLLVLFVLVSLNAFLELLDQLEDVGKHNFGSLQAITYVFYTLPGRVYESLPTATLVGTLVGLGTLASSSQITAMRAAGMSVMDFIFSTFKSGMVLALIAFVIGEWVSPRSWQVAEEMRAAALSEQLSVNRRGGLWLRDQDRFVHAKSVMDDYHLKGITIYTFKERVLTGIIAATAAEKTDQGWVLIDANETLIESDNVVTKTRGRINRGELVPEGMLDVLRVGPEEMSGRDLYQYIKYMNANDLDASNYQLAFLNRFIHPFNILVMMFIAVPFLFSHQRGGGAGQRLFVGVVLGISFFLLNLLFNQLGVVYGVPVLLSALCVPLVAVCVTTYFLRYR